MAHACVRGTVQCSAYDASPQTMSSRPRASQFLRPQRRSAVLRSRASVGVLASYHEEQAKKTVQQRAAEVDNMISKWKKRKEGIDSGNPVMVRVWERENVILLGFSAAVRRGVHMPLRFLLCEMRNRCLIMSRMSFCASFTRRHADDAWPRRRSLR